jgi:hypothetical protein
MPKAAIVAASVHRRLVASIPADLAGNAIRAAADSRSPAPNMSAPQRTFCGEDHTSPMLATVHDNMNQ